MSRELSHLQWITLGSVVVLVFLCGGLLLVVWLSMRLSQVIERLRVTLSRVVRGIETTAVSLSNKSRPRRPHEPLRQPIPWYSPRQVVVTTEEFVIDAGLGQTVPQGSRVELIERKYTSSGGRWSALWGSVYIPYLPEELICGLSPATSHSPVKHESPLQPLDWSSGGYPELIGEQRSYATHPHHRSG